MTQDKNIEIARVQREIEGYIGLGPNSLIYEFGEHEGKTTLHLITINPRHNQSFLFHHCTGIDKVDASRKMLDYVKSYKQKEQSYTIQWSIKDDNQLQTSYFSAKNILSALDKLYYDRDPNSITIFSVILNPTT